MTCWTLHVLMEHTPPLCRTVVLWSASTPLFRMTFALLMWSRAHTPQLTSLRLISEWILVPHLLTVSLIQTLLTSPNMWNSSATDTAASFFAIIWQCLTPASVSSTSIRSTRRRSQPQLLLFVVATSPIPIRLSPYPGIPSLIWIQSPPRARSKRLFICSAS